MRKNSKKFTALALTSAMIMGMSSMVFAADPNLKKDATSSFTEGLNEGKTTTVKEDDIASFNIIKDFDSVNNTASAPNAKSPKETFTYTISPYAVWNAGSTYANNDQTGVATKITKDNMPMLYTGATTIAAGENLVVKQIDNAGSAKYESEDDTENTGDNKVEIKLPEYKTVGDYWYKVVEKNNETTGVIYSTNSVQNDGATDATDNHGYSRTYYIHVQVTELNTNSGIPSLVRNVTMHKTCPNPETTAYDTDAEYNAYVEGNSTNYVAADKVNAIENKYYAGDLTIKKEVTGNAGDKDQYFKVTVTFKKDKGTIVNSDITYKAFAYDSSSETYTNTDFVIKGQSLAENYPSTTVVKNWDVSSPDEGAAEGTGAATVSVDIYVKDADTVTFSNIPYGITYEITEEKPTDNTYKNEIKFTSNDDAITWDAISLGADTNSTALSDDFSKKATGSISDPSDVVTITNEKTTKIDIGVVLSNTPYFAILACAAAGIVFSRRRKETIEE